MTYLLDTNVISELVSPQPNPNVIDWIEGVAPERVFLSVITMGELRRGIEKLRDSRRKSKLSEWLTAELLVRFADQILPIDVDVALTWGELVASAAKIGKPIPAIDSLIAATAVSGGLKLATRNMQDFRAAGVALLNPWESPD
ncbi:MAG: type II toxin-antitoxin system VapC family toxin [Anaerolineae bacterium]|nr:MAG: type II toxin-antitoxin system VapC family toxin [Anaerolineae bacterium]